MSSAPTSSDHSQSSPPEEAGRQDGLDKNQAERFFDEHGLSEVSIKAYFAEYELNAQSIGAYVEVVDDLFFPAGPLLPRSSRTQTLTPVFPDCDSTWRRSQLGRLLALTRDVETGNPWPNQIVPKLILPALCEWLVNKGVGHSDLVGNGLDHIEELKRAIQTKDSQEALVNLLRKIREHFQSNTDRDRTITPKPKSAPKSADAPGQPAKSYPRPRKTSSAVWAQLLPLSRPEGALTVPQPLDKSITKRNVEGQGVGVHPLKVFIVALQCTLGLRSYKKAHVQAYEQTMRLSAVVLSCFGDSRGHELAPHAFATLRESLKPWEEKVSKGTLKERHEQMLVWLDKVNGMKGQTCSNGPAPQHPALRLDVYEQITFQDLEQRICRWTEGPSTADKQATKDAFHLAQEVASFFTDPMRAMGLSQWEFLCTCIGEGGGADLKSLKETVKTIKDALSAGTTTEVPSKLTASVARRRRGMYLSHFVAMFRRPEDSLYDQFDPAPVELKVDSDKAAQLLSI